ncbi:hypothetical protein HK405_005166, partial [Cladochytrium tenue]
GAAKAKVDAATSSSRTVWTPRRTDALFALIDAARAHDAAVRRAALDAHVRAQRRAIAAHDAVTAAAAAAAAAAEADAAAATRAEKVGRLRSAAEGAVASPGRVLFRGDAYRAEAAALAERRTYLAREHAAAAALARVRHGAAPNVAAATAATTAANQSPVDDVAEEDDTGEDVGRAVVEAGDTADDGVVAGPVPVQTAESTPVVATTGQTSRIVSGPPDPAVVLAFGSPQALAQFRARYASFPSVAIQQSTSVFPTASSAAAGAAAAQRRVERARKLAEHARRRRERAEELVAAGAVAVAAARHGSVASDGGDYYMPSRRTSMAAGAAAAAAAAATRRRTLEGVDLIGAAGLWDDDATPTVPTAASAAASASHTDALFTIDVTEDEFDASLRRRSVAFRRLRGVVDAQTLAELGAPQTVTFLSSDAGASAAGDGSAAAAARGFAAVARAVGAYSETGSDTTSDYSSPASSSSSSSSSAGPAQRRGTVAGAAPVIVVVTVPDQRERDGRVPGGCIEAAGVAERCSSSTECGEADYTVPYDDHGGHGVSDDLEHRQWQCGNVGDAGNRDIDRSAGTPQATEEPQRLGRASSSSSLSSSSSFRMRRAKELELERRLRRRQLRLGHCEHLGMASVQELSRTITAATAAAVEGHAGSQGTQRKLQLPRLSSAAPAGGLARARVQWAVPMAAGGWLLETPSNTT